MCVAILNCQLEKIEKLNIVTAVTCAIVVKNFSFLAFENENVKTLSRVFKMIFGGCNHVFSSLFDKPSANIIAGVTAKLYSIDKKVIL